MFRLENKVLYFSIKNFIIKKNKHCFRYMVSRLHISIISYKKNLFF